MSDTKTDTRILEIALQQVTKQLNYLVESCTDQDGKPTTPNHRSVMESRACLPSWCSMSFKKK